MEYSDLDEHVSHELDGPGLAIDDVPENAVMRIQSLRYVVSPEFGRNVVKIRQLPRLVATGLLFSASGGRITMEDVTPVTVWARQVKSPLDVAKAGKARRRWDEGLDQFEPRGEDHPLFLPIYDCNFDITDVFPEEPNPDKFIWLEYFQDAFAEPGTFNKKSCDAGYMTLSNFVRDIRQCQDVMFPVYFGPGSGVPEAAILKNFMTDVSMLQQGIDMYDQRAGHDQRFTGDLSLIIGDLIGGYKIAGTTGNRGTFGTICCYARSDRRLAEDVHFLDVVLNRRRQRRSVLVRCLKSCRGLSAAQTRGLWRSFGLRHDIQSAMPPAATTDHLTVMHRDKSHLCDLGFVKLLLEDAGRTMGRAGRNIFIDRFNAFPWPATVSRPDLKIRASDGHFVIKLSVGCYRALTMVLLTQIDGILPPEYAAFVRECVLWILSISRTHLSAAEIQVARAQIREIVRKGKTRLTNAKKWFDSPNVHQFMELADRTLVQLGGLRWTDTARFEKTHHVPKQTHVFGSNSPYYRRARVIAIQKTIAYAIRGGRWGKDGCFGLSRTMRELKDTRKGRETLPHPLLLAYTRLPFQSELRQSAMLLATDAKQEFEVAGGFVPVPAKKPSGELSDPKVENLLLGFYGRSKRSEVGGFSSLSAVAHFREAWEMEGSEPRAIVENLSIGFRVLRNGVEREISGRSVSVSSGDSIFCSRPGGSIYVTVGDVVEVTLGDERVKSIWFDPHIFEPTEPSFLAKSIGAKSVSDAQHVRRKRRKKKRRPRKRSSKARRKSSWAGKKNPRVKAAEKEYAAGLQNERNRETIPQPARPRSNYEAFLPMECFVRHVHIIHDCGRFCQRRDCAGSVDPSGRLHAMAACDHSENNSCRSVCDDEHPKCSAACPARRHKCFEGNRKWVVLERGQGFVPLHPRVFYNPVQEGPE
jgi:hypothetical protein